MKQSGLLDRLSDKWINPIVVRPNVVCSEERKPDFEGIGVNGSVLYFACLLCGIPICVLCWICELASKNKNKIGECYK